MKLDIKIEGNAVTGILSGRLDTATAEQFSRDMTPLIDNADKQITLDCKNLEFISSSGLRLFLTLRKATIAKGGKIIITGVSPEIKQVFTITGFSSLFEFA